MRSDPVSYSAPAISWHEWRNVALIWIAALILWIPFYWHARHVALLNPDAQDYAQIARNLSAGKGFITDCMPLSGLEWMRQTGRLGQPWWNVHRFPLPSLIEAGLFRVFGPTDFAASLFSSIFFFATLPLVFFFTRRLFSPRIALVATALFAFGGGPMKDSITGLTEPAATFFFLAALHLVLWPRSLWSFALAGLLTGLAFLNRSSVFLYGIPMLFLIPQTWPRSPWKALLAFCVPGAAAIAPWLLRNIILTGDPMFSLTSALMVTYMSDVSPHTHDWYRFHYEATGSFIRSHPLVMLKKWLTQMGGLWWSDSIRIGDVGPVIPFFLASFLRPYTGLSARLRRWLFGVFLCHFVVLALLSNIPRYYAIFTPFIVMYAADLMVWGWDALATPSSWRRTVLAGILAAPTFLSWLYILGPPRRFRDFGIRFETRPGNQQWLRRNTPEGALIVSDIPWSVAWYGARRSLAIPPTPEDMPRFADYQLAPDGIYLKAPQHIMDVPEGWDEWRRVQVGRLPLPGYGPPHVFPDQSVYYARLR